MINYSASLRLLAATISFAPFYCSLAYASNQVAPVHVGNTSTASPKNQSYDFGTLEATKITVISVPFLFRNTSTHPLRIAQLKSSCGCTAAALRGKAKLPFTLAPGAALPVTVNIDSYHLTPGSVDKSVSIYAAGRTNPVGVLRVTGTILAPVLFTPSSLDFGRLESGQAASLSLSVVYDHGLDTNSEDLALVSQSSDVTVVPVGGPKPYAAAAESGDKAYVRYTRTFTVRLDPGHAIGNLNGSLTAVLRKQGDTNHDVELGEATYFADVLGSIDALPKVIAFGQVIPGKSSQQTFLIAGKSLSGLSATSAVSNISVKLGPINHGSGIGRPFGAPASAAPSSAGNETVEATVSLMPPTSAGAFQTSVVITTTDGEKLTVPVYAFVGLH